MKTSRRIVLGLFFAACASVGLVLFFLVAIVINSSGGSAGSTQFVNKSGPSAKISMTEWPIAIDPTKVRSVSRKHDYSFDSHSTWYKIQLDIDSAHAWADFVHADRERHSRDSLRPDDRGLEGVRRIVTGPPPLNRTTGDTHVWCTPPSIEFRATEAMRRYSSIDSGVGQAAYTGYDSQGQTLWVYEYACQHDQLWEANEIPMGDVFSRMNDRDPIPASKPPNDTL